MEDLVASVAGGGSVNSQLLTSAALALALAAIDQLSDEEDGMEAPEPDPAAPREKRSRRQRKRRNIVTCAWAQLLVDPHLNDPNSMAATEFRKDFRVPYSFFVRLVELAKTKGWFSTRVSDCAGRLSHPVEHKVWTA